MLGSFSRATRSFSSNQSTQPKEPTLSCNHSSQLFAMSGRSHRPAQISDGSVHLKLERIGTLSASTQRKTCQSSVAGSAPLFARPHRAKDRRAPTSTDLSGVTAAPECRPPTFHLDRLFHSPRLYPSSHSSPAIPGRVDQCTHLAAQGFLCLRSPKGIQAVIFAWKHVAEKINTPHPSHPPGFAGNAGNSSIANTPKARGSLDCISF